MKNSLVAVVVLLILSCIGAALRTNERTKDEPPAVNSAPVSAEKVGESAGKTTRKFGRGFVKGWKAEAQTANAEARQE